MIRNSRLKNYTEDLKLSNSNLFQDVVSDKNKEYYSNQSFNVMSNFSNLIQSSKNTGGGAGNTS